MIATPLDIPSIKPDSWETFLNVWDKYSAPLVKVSTKNNPTSTAGVGEDNMWQGLDLYIGHTYNTVWQAPYFDIKDALPGMYRQIKELPFKRLYRVRVIQSRVDIPAHSDDNKDQWYVRAFLKLEDPEPQWYFTKPYPRAEKVFLNMPQDTNWFAYNDKHCWHGTNYNPYYPKFLVQLYLYENISELVEKSADKYRTYTITV